MKYKSHTAATETLKSFFVNHPSSDIISLSDIYVAIGRDLAKPELNKQWLSNVMTHLKHYQLVEPIYSVSAGNRRILDKIILTGEGRRALGRNSTSASLVPPITREVSLQSIADDIKEFQKKSPSIKLDLQISIREGVEEEEAVQKQ